MSVAGGSCGGGPRWWWRVVAVLRERVVHVLFSAVVAVYPWCGVLL